MTTYRDQAVEFLTKAGGDVAIAAAKVYNSASRGLILYVITLGLGTLKAKQRRQRRRELKVEVKPQYTAGRTTGSIKFTKATQKRLIQHAQDLFGADGWMIGDLQLGGMTKEQLIAQAESEEASAKGSLRNARFYRALAEPLKSGQKAGSYWKREAGLKLRDEIFHETETKKPALV